MPDLIAQDWGFWKHRITAVPPHCPALVTPLRSTPNPPGPLQDPPHKLFAMIYLCVTTRANGCPPPPAAPPSCAHPLRLLASARGPPTRDLPG